MSYVPRRVNLVLSGGGVKGIAYVGVCEVAEKRNYRWGNIAGVSAGALAGAFTASGFSSYEMWQAMKKFDFEGVQMEKMVRELPVVSDYLEFINKTRLKGPESINEFLNSKTNKMSAGKDSSIQLQEQRGGILSSIITYSKYGYLFDGDYLEEWCARELAKKGVRTFADLRGGIKDKVNPRGYKVRMTGVDCNRAKIVVLPDDVAFYGINPDEFEVAKAVRISTCVPFAFKPVVLKRKEGDKEKSYNLVDGGVFDRFPYWAIDRANKPTIGFRLDGGKKQKFFSIDTALDILKSLISAVHDIGLPEDDGNYIRYVGRINTGKISFLDFGLSDKDKEYLYNSGRQTAIHLFNKFEHERIYRRLGIFGLFLRPFLRRGWK